MGCPRENPSATFHLAQGWAGEQSSARVQLPVFRDVMGVALVSSSVLGYEERSSSTNPEGPSHHQPYWDETR